MHSALYFILTEIIWMEANSDNHVLAKTKIANGSDIYHVSYS
jgi:hypothetical protein